MKAFTNLEQSCKLAEILPLESADMFYHYNVGIKSYYEDAPRVIQVNNHFTFFHRDIPCWSLAALLSVLEHPRCFQGDKPTYWFCGCFDKDKLYHEVEADNPVDACFEMIVKLHKMNLL